MNNKEGCSMREISITELQNLKIGQAENARAGTGCTVFLLGENGAPVGLDVRGGASCSSPRRRRRSSTPFCWAAAVRSGSMLRAA